MSLLLSPDNFVHKRQLPPILTKTNALLNLRSLISFYWQQLTKHVHDEGLELHLKNSLYHCNSMLLQPATMSSFYYHSRCLKIRLCTQAQAKRGLPPQLPPISPPQKKTEAGIQSHDKVYNTTKLRPKKTGLIKSHFSSRGIGGNVSGSKRIIWLQKKIILWHNVYNHKIIKTDSVQSSSNTCKNYLLQIYSQHGNFLIAIQKVSL